MGAITMAFHIPCLTIHGAADLFVERAESVAVPRPGGGIAPACGLVARAERLGALHGVRSAGRGRRSPPEVAAVAV